MRRERRFSGIIGGILCFLMAFSVLATGVTAKEQELQPVRVGFFAFDGYHMIDEDGTRSGYGYDVLQHMAGYTDWQYEYVGYDKSWSEMQDMLENGEIDLLTSAQKTEERMQRFDFSAEPIGISSAILTVKAGDGRYALADYRHWDGMRVGMLEDSSRNDSFAAFAADHGFTYVPTYFESTAEMLAALNAGGSIDAVLTSNLRSIDGEWIMAQFDPSPFYIIVQKGNTALLAEIDRALEHLNNDEPELFTGLMDTYYTPESGDDIAFTLEERSFIAAMNDVTFTALINPDRVPFSYFENGQPVGIISDIAAEIIERSGLHIDFIETAGRAEYRRLAEEGIADIRFDACLDYSEAEEMGYRLTAGYLDISISRLFTDDRTGFTSVALLRDSDITNRYGDYFDAHYKTVMLYDSLDEVIEAVLSGRQDHAYLYTRSAEQAVRDDVTNRLNSEYLYGYDTAFAVAVNAHQDPLLFSIMNKTAASLGEREIQQIVQRNTTEAEQEFSLLGFVYDNPLFLVGLVVLIFLVLGLAIVLLAQSRKRRRDHAQLEEEKRRNALLVDAVAAAESAGKAKSQFLSRMSHEMRTPLNAIIGFMTLAHDAEQTQVREYLGNSEVAARQLLSVINDVLDMSSIESGKIRIAHAPFDLKHLIHSITGMYVAQCRQKGLEYETRLLTPVAEWLTGDQLRVNQILMNLLSNAVKFTEQGHVWLEISQLQTKDDKVFIRFQVSDSGCGMSEEMQARLFKPFEQEDSLTAQKYGGSGLGLSIVKNLVAMMDGAIRVDSRRGEGTTFTVDLPFIKSEEAPLIPVPAGTEHLRVLAVDDQPAERKYIETVLGRMGIRHTCVTDGDEALIELEGALAAQDVYNVCLIDWRLPHMSGLEITRLIRDRYGKQVAVIVVSAYEHNQAAESAKAAGADMFIPKPLFQSALFDLFMTLTDGRIAPTAEALPPGDFAGRRVLLAEDNAMNRMVAEGIVNKFGITCETAADGQIALDKFLAAPVGYYDAILMDIQMPNLDGLAATRAIRASDHPEARSIRIIALTANAFNEDIAKTLSSGMNAHVAKPIEPDVLAKVLDQAFQTRSTENHRETE